MFVGSEGVEATWHCCLSEVPLRKRIQLEVQMMVKIREETLAALNLVVIPVVGTPFDYPDGSPDYLETLGCTRNLIVEEVFVLEELFEGG